MALDMARIFRDKPAKKSLGEKNSKEPNVETKGISVVDINNDGFMDIVVSYGFGYTRFYHNVPSLRSRNNRYISILLKGAKGVTNEYGIGSTITLYSKENNMSVSRQFKEVSSHLHSSDKYGNNDPRIMFGLGRRSPTWIIVRWPNGDIQKRELGSWWKFKSGRNIPLVIDHQDFLERIS